MKYFFQLIILLVAGNKVMGSYDNSVIGYRSTVNGIPSSVNRQPSSVYRQPSTVNRIPSTVIRQPSTSNDTSSFNRSAFYKAMQGNNKEMINAQLTELKSLEPKNAQNAFLGAMNMKKASMGGSPMAKLHIFKEGHKMLESAILQDPANVEFRFLRLLIQENAPGVLGYKNNEETDSEIIRKSYKSLPSDLQHVIADYNKKSKFLKLEVS
jgi:hypothetical protein